MKLKIQMLIAMAGGLVAACFRRPDCVALGNNAETAPPDVTQPRQQQQQQQQKSQSSAESLQAENEELKQKVARLESQQPKMEAVIRKKMEAGLTREQAEAAVQHQKLFTKRFEDVIG